MPRCVFLFEWSDFAQCLTPSDAGSVLLHTATKHPQEVILYGRGYYLSLIHI